MRRIWIAAAIQGACNMLGIFDSLGYSALTLRPMLEPSDVWFLLRWVAWVCAGVYIFVPIVLGTIGWPVGRALSALEAGRPLDPAKLQVAQSRALNLPILFGCTSTLVWLICGLTVFPAWQAAHPGESIPLALWRGMQIIALTGAVSSSFVFYAVEAYMRRFVVPLLIPDGRVSAVRGALFVPVWARVALLLVTSTIAPIIVLVLQSLYTQATPATILYIGFVFLTVGALQALFLCTTIAEPLRALAAQMARVQAGDLRARAAVVSRDDVGFTAEGFNEMVAGLARAETVRDTFGRYVTRQVLDEILSGRIQLGGELRTATVLFADIRGFTALSERLPPKEVVQFLNEYLDIMVDALVEHGGTIDKFIGDAILASFGVPLSAQDDATRAVKAAIAMLDRLEAWNAQRRAAGEPDIDIGIGLHTGPVVAGNIGSAKKMEYTVIGDTVNTSSRIEQLNKELGTKLLVSSATYALVKGSVRARELPPVEVKGKKHAVEIYEILGLATAPDVAPAAASPASSVAPAGAMPAPA